MGYNIFVQRKLDLYIVVFPKCGWTLFNTHCLYKDKQFYYLHNNSFPISKINIDAFFIRNPVDRIISGFKNKYLDRPDNDPWTRDWLMKQFNLRTKEEIRNISFDLFLDKLEELVSKAKYSRTNFFAGFTSWFDVHFCPFNLQLKAFPQKNKLFLDIRNDLDYLDYIGIDHTIIKNSSQHIPFKATQSQKDRIAKIYEEDMIIYENYEKNRHNRPSIKDLMK